MINTQTFTEPLAECADVQFVGGKAANLGKLIRAGFPVPGGFAVTTDAFRHAMTSGAGVIPEDVAEAIRTAYRAMGSPPVAVRSSATAEDMADASMAGQYETYLDIRGEDALLVAVKRCWESISSPRIRAYFREHGIDPDRVAMAVAVQELVGAEVAGVLFTANPNAAAGQARREMLLEASWGLGEMVVSGRVQPDIMRLHADTGEVLSTIIADKRTQLLAGSHEEQPVPESQRRLACLLPSHVKQLWELGRKAADHFGGPQDLEWARRDGNIFLLQSRPITTLKEAEEAQRIAAETRDRLDKELASKRGPWVVHNLGETLPHPTPLTWSILQPFMAGAGGFGEMYRQAGFQPGHSVQKEGFLELIAGRIYMDASRAPEMFFENFPFAYDVEELKRSPDASQSPPTIPTGSLAARFKTGRRLAAVQERLRSLSADTDRQLRNSLFPGILQYVADAREVDLTKLNTEQLIERWLLVQDQVLDSLAPQLLMPSLIGGMALADLRAFLAEHFWQESPDTLAQLLSSGGPANRTLIADADLYDVGKRKLSVAEWIKEHGHRAAGEFDIAAPRWREQPEQIAAMAATFATGENPMDRYRHHTEIVQRKVDDLRRQLTGSAVRGFDERLDLVRRYMIFREDSKDFLMLGYDLLRDVSRNAASRLELGEDIFHLTQEEVIDALRESAPDSRKRAARAGLIARRKLAYAAEVRIDLPRVIDAPAVKTLGEPAPGVERTGGHNAFAVSAGMARGPARILKSPTDAGSLGKGYILVCPSTDPSWTPLFVNAVGLVIECGGTLSHGAVVAREMGLPAVVLPDATRMFTEGQEIAIDGTAGWIGPAELLAARNETQAVDPNDTQIPLAMLPPPAGPKDRRATKVSNLLALAWGIYLLAFFLLPAQAVQKPTLQVIDAVLWPVVRAAGKPLTVALVAAAIAITTLLIQKLMTDNARLMVAKRRAATLQKQANTLPRESPRRKAFLAAAAPVTGRTLAAAMVPIGILLGPLVMPFVWFQHRVEPTAAASPAGSPVSIVAKIDSNYKDAVQIQLPPGMKLDIATPAVRSITPLRAPLEHLLALYQLPETQRAAAWELNVAQNSQPPEYADPAAAARDLKAYLDKGIPPQAITWLVLPPEHFDGTFPVTVATPSKGNAIVQVTLGEHDAPSPTIAMPVGPTPVKELSVVYSKSNQPPVFWQPFPHVNISWLWVYILAYIPVLLIARPLLKVA